MTALVPCQAALPRIMPEAALGGFSGASDADACSLCRSGTYGTRSGQPRLHWHAKMRREQAQAHQAPLMTTMRLCRTHSLCQAGTYGTGSVQAHLHAKMRRAADASTLYAADAHPAALTAPVVGCRLGWCPQGIRGHGFTMHIL